MRRKTTFPAVFAGERIALYRGESDTVYALEDRCAHRQVPLSMGVVEGESLRCCYHAWAYRGNGRVSQIPYLPKGAGRPPRGVRSYPVREAYGLVFVFPGDPRKADTTAFPELPEFDSGRHKTMRFSRTVGCHYSFMHENLLDMNHQFLHRGIVGKIQPELLGYDTGPRSVQARYLFTHAGGRKDRGAGVLASTKSPDIVTIRTTYPYQTLQLVPEDAGLATFSLWVAYVPEDAGQRTSHVYGLLMIQKPPVPGLLHLAWPLIRRFTERVFAEDRLAVEAEQRAWDEQGQDLNHEVFPLILDVRHVLRTNGVAVRPDLAPCGAAAFAAAHRCPRQDHAGQGEEIPASELLTANTKKGAANVKAEVQPPPPASSSRRHGRSAFINLGALRQTIPVSKHQALFRARIIGYAYEFERGFLWQLDDAEPQTYRWDEVATVNWYASQHYVNGVYSGTTFWITLMCTDGRSLKISGTCKDPTAKGAHRADPQAAGYLLFQFLIRVRDTVSAAQLPDAIAAFNRGERLSFGDLQISSAGIQAPKGFVPWSSIKAVNVVQGRVSVRQQGKFLALSSKGVEQIPNCPLFLTLAQMLTRQAPNADRQVHDI